MGAIRHPANPGLPTSAAGAHRPKRLLASERARSHKTLQVDADGVPRLRGLLPDGISPVGTASTAGSPGTRA
jgi:hypothetical protein